jgi:hypothetical protein
MSRSLQAPCVEVKASRFGGGFDVIRHTPADEDDEAASILVATKGTAAEANAEAREEYRIILTPWQVLRSGPAPTLILWPVEASDASS